MTTRTRATASRHLGITAILWGVVGVAPAPATRPGTQDRPAATGRVELSPRSCRPASARTRGALDASWKPFARFIRSCDVRLGARPTALTVVTIDVDAYYASLGAAARLTRFPPPLIKAPSGRVLGELPHQFPSEPPLWLDVAFTDWRRNLPRRVELSVSDPAVSGDRTLPALVWRDAAGRFLATPHR